MPKMEGAGNTRKISIEQIDALRNVRADYKDIEDLAESIRKIGQLQPVIVKAVEEKDGQPRYELVAGFRRLNAFKHLIEKGEPFTSIDAVIVTGDNLTIQLVENIQRSDLLPAERERGIYQMKENGLNQIQIAEKLSKTEEWVSRNISAFKIRKTLDEAGINTAEIPTGVLNEMQAAKTKDLPGIMRTILDGGGTQKVARAVMQEYREKNKPPRLDLPGPAPETPSVDNEAPSIPPPAANTDGENIDPLAGGGIETDPPPEPESPPPKTEKQKPEPRREPPTEYDTEHKTVDINIVLTAIYKHLEKLKKSVAEYESAGQPFPSEYGRASIQVEAVEDVIALIHKAL